MKRLGLRPGDTAQTGFQLPGHAERNLTSAQLAEIIAEHFSAISQEYSPINVDFLPRNLQLFLQKNDNLLAPRLSPKDVQSRIIKAKKPHGLVPGDLPKKLVKKCAHILAHPVSIIFNQITVKAVYPKQWKIEHQIALPKSFPPETEDQLRNIAILEQIV